jgi:hypothetical protein
MNSQMSSSFRVRLSGLACGFWLAFCASSAAASPNSPDQLAEVADTKCVPTCSVCHTTNPGRAGTGTQPFASQFKGYTGRFIVPPSLGDQLSDGQVKGIFETMRRVAQAPIDANVDGLDDITGTSTMLDSNLDGIDDFTAMNNGEDPNTGAELCIIEYGCLRLDPTSPVGSGRAPWLGALALALTFGLSRRRRG